MIQDVATLSASLHGLMPLATCSRRASSLRSAPSRGVARLTLMVEGGMPLDRAPAVATYLALVLDRVADYTSNLCRWHNLQMLLNTFARQALPMVWTFRDHAVRCRGRGRAHICRYVSGHCGALAATGRPAKVVRTSATQLPPTTRPRTPSSPIRLLRQHFVRRLCDFSSG